MGLTLSQFYTSEAWERFRKLVIAERRNAQGDVICALCGNPITEKYDIIAHHKEILSDLNVNNVEVTLNPDNIELVHFKCHNKYHHRYSSFQRHIYVVYGSPCAGKSEFVLERALQDDLIIDINDIYKAINTVRNPKLSTIAREVREKLVDIVRVRQGKWVNAWLVGNNFRGCYLWGKSDRERLSADLGAELIYIDTPKDMCLARAAEKGPDYVKRVNEWFDCFQE